MSILLDLGPLSMTLIVATMMVMCWSIYSYARCYCEAWKMILAIACFVYVWLFALPPVFHGKGMANKVPWGVASTIEILGAVAIGHFLGRRDRRAKSHTRKVAEMRHLAKKEYNNLRGAKLTVLAVKHQEHGFLEIDYEYGSLDNQKKGRFELISPNQIEPSNGGLQKGTSLTISLSDKPLQNYYLTCEAFLELRCLELIH